MATIPTTPPEGSQKALIEAGLRLFGQQGFDATSTRALAAEAGVNVALIAYHFGGKEGLRQAVTAEVARRIFAAAGTPSMPDGLTPDEALDRLTGILRRIAMFIVAAPEAEVVVNFALHELTQGGPVVDRIYEGFVGPKHAELCALWGLAADEDPESDAVRLSVFAAVGQILYFRVGASVVKRKMGWPAVTPDHARRIADLVTANVRCLIRKDAP